MIRQAVEFLQSKSALRPAVAVVLGSGLGGFATEVEEALEIPYADIPGWPQSSLPGHAGKLVLGRTGSTAVAVLSGRVHLYEGYSPREVVFPTRVMGKFGVQSIVYTNAAGGINLRYQRGALVLIRDHINLQGANPLTGPNDDWLGPRFPDMSAAYDEQLRIRARQTAAAIGLQLEEGVYAAVAGPSFETPAEIRFLRAIGADLVGMSTVPEVIAANHMGLRVLAISCVTNMAAGILPRKITHEEVLETGEAVRATLVRLLKALLPKLQD